MFSFSSHSQQTPLAKSYKIFRKPTNYRKKTQFRPEVNIYNIFYRNIRKAKNLYKSWQTLGNIKAILATFKQHSDQLRVDPSDLETF